MNQFPWLGCSLSGAGLLRGFLFCQQPPLLPFQPRAWEQLVPVARPRALTCPLWFLPSAHISVNSPLAKLFPINPLVEHGFDSLRQQEWWCPGQSQSHLTNHGQDILSSPPLPARCQVNLNMQMLGVDYVHARGVGSDVACGPV